MPDCATCKHHTEHLDMVGKVANIWCWLYRKYVTEVCGNYDDREPGSEG